ncbi:MAG: hypothetical protein ABIZ80_02300, partial [Bryobacteraceae bacterium]
MDRIAAIALLASAATGLNAADVTFTRDIAAILYAKCASCHRPGEIAPFSLITYADASKRAAMLAQVTASRYMPPWKPEPEHGDFAGARGLDGTEIEKIRRWASAGAPEGNPVELPSLPAFTSASRLDHADLTISMPQAFELPAEGPDLYQCFVVPLGLNQTRYVNAIEFMPGNPKVLHHALLFTDRSGVARGKGATYPCFGAPGFLPGAGLGGWSPGSPPIRMPDGASVAVLKGSDLVLQLHFHPTGKPESAKASVRFQFTDQPPRKRLMDIPLGSRLIDIAPGDASYRVRDSFVVPVDVDAIG